MKNLGKLMAVFATVILLAGCGQPDNAMINEDGKKVVKIGVVAPMSGPAAAYGEDASNSFQLVAKEFNEMNEDVQVELIVEDGKCEGKDAISATQKLINIDQVNVIVGGLCSSETLAAGKVAQQNGVLMIAPLSSSPEISNIGDMVFRFYNDVDQTQAIVDYLGKNDKNKVALVYQNNDYGTALGNQFKKTFKGEILLEEKFNSDEKDMSIIVKKIVDQIEDIDMVVVVPQDDNRFLNILRAIESEDAIELFAGKIIGSETTYSNNLVESAKASIEGNLTTQFPPFETFGQEAANFVEKFEMNYEIKSLNSFLALHREGIALALDAVMNNPESPVEYVRSITEDNPRNGFFGEYYFDAEGDAVGLEFFVNKIVDGELVQQ